MRRLNMTLYIFGDSYACPIYHHNVILNQKLWSLDSAEEASSDIYAWPIQIKKIYSNVKNYALSGTGPHYSFKEYFNLYKNNQFYQNDKIIFFISGNDRIDFPAFGESNITPGHITNIGLDIKTIKPYVSDRANYNVKRYYENFYSEISFYFLTNKMEIHMSQDKNIAFLHMVSQMRKVRTIVFLIGSVSNIDMIEYQKLNNDYFFISEKMMNNVSYNEFKYHIDHLKFNDTRFNHLSDINHQIFLRNLIKMIDNDFTSELEDFEERIVDIDSVNGYIVEEGQEGFIYE